ncbi:MAG: SGNH/GDSL hydrolase family protein [Bacteroides sp.]
MKRNRRCVFWFAALFSLFCTLDGLAQDSIPRVYTSRRGMKSLRQLPQRKTMKERVALTPVNLPAVFRGLGYNQLTDSVGSLFSVWERLRQVKAGLSKDTVRIVHLGDSHIRGHIFPRTTAAKLGEAFGLVSYLDRGVNGATCLTFTHSDRIAAIASLKPELLILSFGTNESHNRNYQANVHYQQMEEFVRLLQVHLPGVPILLTTPPGSYESFRQRRRQRKFFINPRTEQAVRTINRYAATHQLAVWDLYNVVGGRLHACRNWTSARLMRPDQVHYTSQGYVLQGELLYEAILKAYTDYVSH